jgi:hypothetical protein
MYLNKLSVLSAINSNQRQLSPILAVQLLLGVNSSINSLITLRPYDRQKIMQD